MRLHRNPSQLLKEARSSAERTLPHSGINKIQEITRLLYEISKKENSSPRAILKNINSRSFSEIKEVLLKKRYPRAFLSNETSKVFLPKLTLEPDSRVSLKTKAFYPKNILIEGSCSGSNLANKFKRSFPLSTITEIAPLREHIKGLKSFSIKDYNQRRDAIFIINQKHDFFKRCPCTKKAVGCGYHIFNLSFGCIFECSYCYLQEYANTPGIIFPANMGRFFSEFSAYKRPGMRIGTGEFSDSLMLDNVTEYSLLIIDFLKNHKDVTFEFKTKSKNIANLLKAKHKGNIVVSWSLNPQKIIDENEFFTSSLKDRIASARLCAQNGYKIGLHFDPVIYFKDWHKHYEKVIALVFEALKPKDIAWISVGTLRFNPAIKKVIETRFPENKILDEELIYGFDNKLRYPSSLRRHIYEHMFRMLLKHSKKLPIYLCMEPLSMC